MEVTNCVNSTPSPFPTPLELLKRDHAEITGLLCGLKSCCDATLRDQLVGDLFLELRVHYCLEDQLFYPNLCAWLSRAVGSHLSGSTYALLALMLQLEDCQRDQLIFEQTLSTVCANFSDHVAESERLFKQIANSKEAASMNDNNLAQSMIHRAQQLRAQLHRSPGRKAYLQTDNSFPQSKTGTGSKRNRARCA